VLRLYTSTGGRGLDTTEDSPLARELALNDLVHTSVPVPRILRAEPEAEPPWALLEFVDGERFDLALTKMSEFELRQVSRAVGEVLARIHAFEFSEPGFFGSRLEIVQALRGSWLGFVVESMSNGRSRIRVGADLADRLLRVIAEHGSRLEPFWDEARLVHADYKPWNLLVQRTGAAWNLAAVLDWEFAFAGPCAISAFTSATATAIPLPTRTVSSRATDRCQMTRCDSRDSSTSSAYARFWNDPQTMQRSRLTCSASYSPPSTPSLNRLL
jgi:aminoglycoside phosphotransferase (APT) family kinase protein